MSTLWGARSISAKLMRMNLLVSATALVDGAKASKASANGKRLLREPAVRWVETKDGMEPSG